MIEGKAHIGATGCLKAGQPAASRRHGLLLNAPELFCALLAKGVEQRLLIGEVAIDGGGADPDFAGDFS